MARAARALDEKLAEERFNVVVVGEVKRGKTTFVNALLGAEVLVGCQYSVPCRDLAVSRGMNGSCGCGTW